MDYLNEKQLIDVAKKLVTKGKGILAADEFTETIGQRFKIINLENNLKNRYTYRDLLIGANDYELYISGVILCEETLFQKNNDGSFLIDTLKRKDVCIGIKVDKGFTPIKDSPEEMKTFSLIGLDERLIRYYKAGAQFAIWRSIYKIDINKNYPSDIAIKENAELLANYSNICQKIGLVPIIETEILIDGNHSIEQCSIVTEKVLSMVFNELKNNGVMLEGALLKPSMVLPGSEHQNINSKNSKPSNKKISKLTLKAIQNTVPSNLAGVVFLSGGQTEIESTRNLNSINILKTKDSNFNKSLTLSFSFGRALQQSVLTTWCGKSENIQSAREVLVHRAKCNSLATLGQYEGEEYSITANQSLHIENYLG